MATKSNSMFRISQLAKDLGLKTKELTEKLNELGVSTKNTSASLEPDEVNLLFESLSKDSEIKDIDGYLRGKTVITLPESPEESATRYFTAVSIIDSRVFSATAALHIATKPKTLPS